MIEDSGKKKAEVKAINEEVKNVAADTKATKEPEITDIDLGFVERKRFRINGDYNRMLELNVSDMNIFSRFSEAYPKLQDLVKQAQEKINSVKFDSDSDLDNIGKFGDVLTEIDAEMRKLMDYIFDSNVSEVCAPSGNMFDPVDGQIRFERIIDVISTFYSNGLTDELAQLKKKSAKHTAKYTKKSNK